MGALLTKFRGRLVLGFGLAILAMLLFGALSYAYFVRMEARLLLLGQTDGMLDAILEARRFEKNFLLYAHPEDLAQAQRYLGEFTAALGDNRELIRLRQGGAALERLQGAALAYGQRLARAGQIPSVDLPALEAELRAAGKELVEGAEALATGERLDIRHFLRTYRPLLVIFLLALGILGAAMVYLLIIRLVKPLHVIEQATQAVAEGDFQPIPGAQQKDEIGSLVEAFNRMAGRLQENSKQMIQTEKLTALGTLTSGVAHELNNPLNNISTSCQILLEELAPEASPYHRGLLRAMDDQVDKARDIVRSLLEFARPRGFTPQPEDLKAVVEEALKLSKGELPAGVEVRLEVPAGIVLELDKAQMVQALLNLIMNAVQAIEEGGTLLIRAQVGPEGREAVLLVSDTGVGIAPADLPRIFDPFFTTKEVGRGTGLGLSITYGIVERHQGRISVESLPGLGARFYLHLPLAPAAPGGEGQP